MPRWFRFPHLLAKAKDGDGDGMVNDGTPQERPVSPTDVGPKKAKGSKSDKALSLKLPGKDNGGKKRVTYDPSAPLGSQLHPVRVRSAKKALELMSKGQHVELDPRTLAVSLDKLSAMARKAREQGTEAPNINLCLAHLRDTNIFCESNKGIPRIEMPQLKGKNIRPGSSAATKGPNDEGEVDATDEFVAMLKGMGIEMHDEERDAALLKATQSELVGAKVGGMMAAADAGKFDPSKGRIFISRDGFILDGHHRWAATAGLSFRKGQRLNMPVTVIDLPIQELVTATTHFTEGFGIMGNAASPTNKSAPELPCIGCGDEVEKKRNYKIPSPKSTPKEIVGSHGRHKPHGTSILWPALYEELRKKGMTKAKAAAISNGKWNARHGAKVKNATSTRVTKTEPVRATISKLDDEKQNVFGWAYVAHDQNGEIVIDKSGDYIDEIHELESAAYEFVLESRQGGADHAREGEGPVVVSKMIESLVITPEKLDAMGVPKGILPTGAWWTGFHIDDAEVWDEVKKGRYKMFSVHGSGIREPVGKLDDSFRFAGIEKTRPIRPDGRLLTPAQRQQRRAAARKKKRKRKITWVSGVPQGGDLPKIEKARRPGPLTPREIAQRKAVWKL